MEKNKTGKYLKYAVGEILLVVIGILIALSVNNWNEERKQSYIKQNYRLKLVEELDKDLKYLSYLDSMNSIYTSRILIHLKKNKSSGVREIMPLIQSHDNYLIAAYYSNTYTINTLISTGDISLLSDSEKELITKLKSNSEKYKFYEKSEIDAVKSDFQNIKSQFDLIFEYGYSNEIKIAESTENTNLQLNESQYKKYTNFLAEVLNLYKIQSMMYDVIKTLSEDLSNNLKKTKG